MNKPGLTLEETFDIYVKAVQNSDLEALFTTVSKSDDFYFLTAKGDFIDREGYYKFHEGWFKETGWEMPVKLLIVKEGKKYGYTNAIFYYRSKIPEDKIYNLNSYFTLIFHKEDGMWKVIADICAPIERYIKESDTDIKYTMDQEYLFNIIKERRTVRKYKSTPVPEKHIEKIINAARFAPTAGNQQPWMFLVIRNRKKLDQLAEKALQWYMELYQNKANPGKEELKSTRVSLREIIKNALSAPVYVAVLVDPDTNYPEYIIHDGTLASGYLMIAAKSLGYGTGFFTTFFPEKKMKDYLGIPDKYKLICFTPIGVPDEWPDAPAKKELNEVIIYETLDESSQK